MTNRHDRIAVEVFSRQTLAYDDEGSSDSQHDAYWATIIAEGEEKNSEDGKTHLIPREKKEKQRWNVSHGVDSSSKDLRDVTAPRTRTIGSHMSR